MQKETNTCGQQTLSKNNSAANLPLESGTAARVHITPDTISIAVAVTPEPAASLYIPSADSDAHPSLLLEWLAHLVKPILFFSAVGISAASTIIDDSSQSTLWLGTSALACAIFCSIIKNFEVARSISAQRKKNNIHRTILEERLRLSASTVLIMPEKAQPPYFYRFFNQNSNFIFACMCFAIITWANFVNRVAPAFCFNLFFGMMHIFSAACLRRYANNLAAEQKELVHGQFANFKNEVNRLKDQLNEEDEKLKILMNQLNDITTKLAEAINNIESKQNEVKQLSQAFTQVKGKVDETQQGIQNLFQQLQDTNQENNGLPQFIEGMLAHHEFLHKIHNLTLETFQAVPPSSGLQYNEDHEGQTASYPHIRVILV